MMITAKHTAHDRWFIYLPVTGGRGGNLLLLLTGRRVNVGGNHGDIKTTVVTT